MGIEVAMQNTGLATVIAIKHFALLSALPASLVSVAQNILGVILVLMPTVIHNIKNKTKQNKIK